jgi:CubicO group peptidase (beta-lactamase class C family)
MKNMKHSWVVKMCIGLMLCIILSSLLSVGQKTQDIINNPNVASNIKLLDARLQTPIRYGKMPGVSVGIFYNGELIYQKGFVYADSEKKIPTTPDGSTIFSIAYPSFSNT